MYLVEVSGHARRKQDRWGGQTPVKVIINDQGIFVLNYHINPVFQAVSHQFGLIGALIHGWWLERKKKQRQSYFDMTTPENIVKEDPKSYFIPFQSIQSFEFKSGARQLWQKSIELVADDTYYFNLPDTELDMTLSVLRSKCGGREKKG